MTHVAFLRALNVGGKAVVKMESVRKAFDQAGCRDVKTIGHAGNVLYRCGSKSVAAQEKKVLAAMQALMGAKCDICFRELDEVAALVAHDPFGDLVAEEGVHLYVAFMDRELKPKPKLPIVIPKEAIAITGVRHADMFIVSRRKPNGMYGFPNQFIEKLGVMATTRNWNTVLKVAACTRK